MKLSLILVGAGLFVVLLALTLSPVELQASIQVPEPDAITYQLLANPGVEVYGPAYAQYDGADCQVASGWERYWVDGPEPAWMDTRVFDRHLGCDCWVERIEGDTSQLLVSTEPYTAGIRQQVTGLTPGVGYGFHAAMLTIFQSSAEPTVDHTMIKQVGMDPTGGTDPEAPTVVWSEPDDHDEGPWSIDLRTAAYAQSPTMTVFIHVVSPFESGGGPLLNLSFLDSAILARTPTVQAVSPAFSEVPTFTVRWDNATPAPGGGYLRWYDVQWLDQVEGVWHDWFVRTEVLEASFVGEAGHTYRFRARAWQRYPNGAHLYGVYRPGGDTATRVAGPPAGPRLVGTVLDPEGNPIAAAKVIISSTAYAISGPGGWVELDLPPLSVPQTVKVKHHLWASPAPVHGLTWGPTETVTLTWTLRPPGDALANGEFESGLAGWWPLTDTLATPQVVTEPVHTGRGALALGGAVALSGTVNVDQGQAVSQTVGVSQTVVLTDAWEPVLAFWYQPVTTDTDDLFHVILTVVTQTLTTTLPVTGTITPTLPVRVAAGTSAPLTAPITVPVPVTMTQVFTPALDVGGWQALWIYPGLPNRALTGTVTVQFQVWDDGDEAVTTVYVDEVSLGATPGGPFRAHVPIVLRDF